MINKYKPVKTIKIDIKVIVIYFLLDTKDTKTHIYTKNKQATILLRDNSTNLPALSTSF